MLVFYGPSTHFRSFRARSVNLAPLFLASLLDSLPVLSGHSFASNWAASSEIGTYRLCEQRRFRRACASAQSRQNLRCSLIQAVSQEEPSDRSLAPLNGWACAVKICHDGMLEDTNWLDAAQLTTENDRRNLFL